MLGKLQEKQRELFRTRLEDLINPNHELALLAKRVDWQYFEDALTEDQKSFYKRKLDLYTRAVNQQKADTDKIYSLHIDLIQHYTKPKLI